MNNTTEIIAFGEKEDGVEYQLRAGGYLVVNNDQGHIAVVISKNGYFLPGGGLEDTENPEEAAIREAYEEGRLRVKVTGELGIADDFIYVEKKDRHLQKRGHFFEAEVIECDGVGDHELVWLTPEEGIAKLKHGSQKWAVGEWKMKTENARQ